jgi:hypothetical protein
LKCRDREGGLRFPGELGPGAEIERPPAAVGIENAVLLALSQVGLVGISMQPERITGALRRGSGDQ